MATESESEIKEAVETIAHAAGAAVATEAALEAAEEAQLEAEETAEAIVAAAMESERGRRIDQLEKDLGTWRGEQNQQLNLLSETVASLTVQLTEVLAKMNQPTVTAIAAAPAAETPALSNPATSAETPPVVAAVTVTPGAAGDGLPAPAPVTEVPPRKRGKFL